jgi:hypothetical protein
MSSPATTRSVLIPDLEEYRRQFEELSAEVVHLVEGLSEAQFNWRPAPERWAISQAIGHLWITGEVTRKNLDVAIDDAIARGLKGEPPFRYSSIERYVVRVTEPPASQRLPAPKRLHPAHGQPITAVLPTYLHLQSQMIRQIERSNGLDLRRVKVVTPLGRWIKFSLGMTFAQTAAHGRRHLAQMKAVREHPKFPAQ